MTLTLSFWVVGTTKHFYDNYTLKQKQSILDSFSFVNVML